MKKIEELLEKRDTIRHFHIELDGKGYTLEHEFDQRYGAHEVYIYYANEERMKPEERLIPRSIHYRILVAVLNHIRAKAEPLELEAENKTIKVFDDMSTAWG